MDPMSRKRSVHNCQGKVKSGKVVRFRIFRNASDGDSGFDSALSSRSSSISLDQVSSYNTNRMSTDLVHHQSLVVHFDTCHVVILDFVGCFIWRISMRQTRSESGVKKSFSS